MSCAVSLKRFEVWAVPLGRFGLCPSPGSTSKAARADHGHGTSHLGNDGKGERQTGTGSPSMPDTSSLKAGAFIFVLFLFFLLNSSLLRDGYCDSTSKILQLLESLQGARQ